MTVSVTASGHIFLDRTCDPEQIVSIIASSDYGEEFCVAADFSPDFVAALMRAGFLVMSTSLSGEDPPETVLLPKHHLTRTILRFPKLHISMSVRRLLDRYQLRFDTDFDAIVENCVAVHGSAWLTPKLRAVIREIRRTNTDVYPCSFALYRDGVLRAGEFGVLCGGVYTSYSGYFDENSAGRVQMILTARFLSNNGFAFWDLGMPLPYKFTLGAENVNLSTFLELFRAGRLGFGIRQL
jgi:Leu/Phe-tRNA-protein transferase